MCAGRHHQRLSALLLLLLLVVFECTATAQDEPAACSLALASSSLNQNNDNNHNGGLVDLGLGVYAMTDIAAGTVVSQDRYVPILDTYKTLPYRGQQRFKSWFRYVWPTEPDTFYSTRYEGSFPTIPEEMETRFGAFAADFGLNDANGIHFFDDNGEAVNAVAPGLASLVNHAPAPLANVMAQVVTMGGGRISFVALRDIPAGSELFLDYGSSYEERLKSKKNLTKQANNQEDAWAARDVEIHKSVPKKLPSEADKRRKLQTDFVFDYGASNVDPKDVQADDHDKPAPSSQGTQGIRNNQDTIEWLQENGICIDNLYIGETHDGEGAFAKRSFAKGAAVMHAPTLAINRDDLNIYYVDEEAEFYRDMLDLDHVVGQEPLLEYCFGHKESEVLLLPIAPLVSFIRHNAKEPNVKIQLLKQGDAAQKLESQTEELLQLHPLDALDQSGKLFVSFVALRDIQPGEELVMDHGSHWEAARNLLSNEEDESTRHEIGVPDDFFPESWKNQKCVYEIEPPASGKLEPGKLDQLVWTHNGQPIARGIYRVGLPEGYSAKLLEYAESMGLIDRYNYLLNNNVLENDDWDVFQVEGGQEWFQHRYMSNQWNFNMHYIAAWNEVARKHFLGTIGKAGFDLALEGQGSLLGLDNITCSHVSFMGVSECDHSFTHADVYGVYGKGFNFIFPLLVVEGSDPELDIQSDDRNVLVGVNYQYDVAYALGDWGYHKTRAIKYDESSDIRVVAGAYCAQIDETNAKMMAHIYDGEDPAPFMDQFDLPMKEIHWSKNDETVRLARFLEQSP